MNIKKKTTAKASAKKPSSAAKKAASPAKKAAPKKETASAKKETKAAKKETASAKKASKGKASFEENDMPSIQQETVEETAKAPKKQKGAKRGRKPRSSEVKEEIPPNKYMDLAFSFAEEMKKAQRAEADADEANVSSVKLSRRPDTRVKGKNTQKFPASDLAQFKKSLLLLRQVALGQSASLRDIALEQTEERGGEDEDGSDVFLRLQSLSQVDSQNRIVQKIDEALARIADGTYGVCEHCGKLIRKARLLNLPFVHTCMECQILLERRR